MKLSDFYDRIAPFLLGEIEHDAVVPALWGTAPPPPDAARLQIYGRFCQTHRLETVDGIFTACRRVVVDRLGAAAWTALIEEYFRAHPMHHFELNRNAEHFAEFLATEPAAPRPAGWPPFLAALAELEWWEWQVLIAPDHPDDDEPESGPLRLGSTVELRPYDWELLDWLDAQGDDEPPADPEPTPTVVLFWRDRDLDGRRELATPLEMLIIKAIVESVPLDAKLAARLGVPIATLTETAADLHTAGIILGDLARLVYEADSGSAD